MLHTTLRQISISSSRRGISLLLILLLCCIPASAQKKKKMRVEPDTIPWFRGLQVSADLEGPIQLAVSDYGQYEAALKVNLKDKYFPTLELGYGIADHDEIASNRYKTKAPYGRIGCDFNILKDKHQPYRAFAGLRYAYTSYKDDVSRDGVFDPVWRENVEYDVRGNKCYYHWWELVAGVDAKVMGPIHLGWTVRYKRRLAYDEGVLGKSWYVPGYGISGSSKIGVNFNFIIDLWLH